LTAVSFGTRQESAITDKVQHYVLVMMTRTKYQITSKFKIQVTKIFPWLGL